MRASSFYPATTRRDRTNPTRCLFNNFLKKLDQQLTVFFKSITTDFPALKIWKSKVARADKGRHSHWPGLCNAIKKYHEMIKANPMGQGGSKGSYERENLTNWRGCFGKGYGGQWNVATKRVPCRQIKFLLGKLSPFLGQQPAELENFIKSADDTIECHRRQEGVHNHNSFKRQNIKTQKRR